MSRHPPPARRAAETYRLPPALTRGAGMPLAPTAPAVPSALRAFNKGIVDVAPVETGAGDPGPEPRPEDGDMRSPGTIGDAGRSADPPAPPDAPPPVGSSSSPPPRSAEPVAFASGPRGRPGLIAVVLIVAVIAVVVSVIASSRLVSLSARQQTDPAIAAAQARAASGDVQGAVRSLDDRAASASPDARILLRGAEAAILTDAARTTAAHDPVAALVLLRQAAGFADTPQGHDARTALPGALVDAARQILRTPPADGSAAALLHEAITTAPASPAATLATQLLGEPVPVTGRLSIAGAPARGVSAALFAVAVTPAPAHPSSSTPVASAACGAGGAFDLGLVPPGDYVIGDVDPAGHVHSGPVVTVAPAQLNDLVISLPG